MKQPDYVQKKFGPQKRRHLLEALASRIASEFPRLGGPRIQRLCAGMILEVVEEHVRPPQALTHGQVLWMAIDKDDPPCFQQSSRSPRLLSVILDLSSSEDIDAILARAPAALQLQQRCVRLCQQAYQQNALLSNCDLALLLGRPESVISHCLVAYEKLHGTVPRRATLHDVGTGLTHKEQICRLYFQEGLQANEVARRTFHSLRAVDRYLSQYQRVLHCHQRGFPPQQIALTLNCSLRLVLQYLRIQAQLRQKGEAD